MDLHGRGSGSQRRCSLNTHRAIGLCLGLSVLAFGATDARAQASTNVPGIEKFRVAGPERVTVMAVGICTRFLPPEGPAASRPGLGWANGTGGNPNTYTGILTRVASFG